MIDIRNLKKTFLTHKGDEIHAVNGLSFSVARGEIYGLLGPNGAGKTTTLRMMAGLMSPTDGYIAADEHVAVDVARHVQNPMALKERIGFLTANTGLYERLTPREVLTYFGELRGIEPDVLATQVARLIADLMITEYADRRCEGLSTGQKQRVQIARTLVGNPPVLILDEPTLGLDVLTNQLILKFIVQAGREGRTIILSTHHLDEVEDVCDRFGLIHKGAFLASGTLAELRAQSGQERLSAIFRELVRRVDPEVVPQLTLAGDTPGPEVADAADAPTGGAA